MTRQHFIWFAQWIEMYPNLTMDYDALDDLMNYFYAKNSHFDRRKFLSACGFSVEEIDEIWEGGPSED